MLADLGAGTNGGPGIYHGAFTDISADVHKRRHQHDIGCYIGALAYHSTGNGAKACLGKRSLVVLLEFQRHLVIEGSGLAGHDAVFVDPEGQKNRFLDPVVDLPLSVDFFRHTQGTVIQLFDHGMDGRAQFNAVFLGGEGSSLFPRRFDQTLEVAHRLGSVNAGRLWQYRDTEGA